MRIIFYALIFFIIFFVIRILARLLSQPSKSSTHSFSRQKEEKKFENIQDAQFTEIKSEDSKKNE
jgi:hypothetical protein